MKRHDITIIGGGIVGLATAYSLSRRFDGRLLLLEAEEKLAAHQTGNNSGVIHSGLYYRPGSFKARNCVEGREALYAFCEEYAIPHERCGKLVVATREEELPYLDDLERRGRENGLRGLKRLTAGELRDYEPEVAGRAGLLVPETGIVDYTLVTEKFAELFQENGGIIRTRSRVRRVVRYLDHLVLETTGGEVETAQLINCAGLQSDRVARLCGLDPGMRIVPFRGEYYKLRPESRNLVRNLIYPVPDPRFPFLGVHFTRLVDGGREAGPNAVLAFKREGYHRFSFSLRDTLSTFTYPAFWKLAGKYWRTGMGEFYRSFNRGAFVRALQKLIPRVQSRDLEPGGAGVRAQALAADGRLVDDFLLLEAERMIHVLNAPSPAATASLSIGAGIADLAAKNFHLPRRGDFRTPERK